MPSIKNRNMKDVAPTLFFILTLFCSIQIKAQEEFRFQHLEVAGSIPQSIVYCLDQDSLGNIWAGTEEGIIRYNSTEMYLYNKYKGLSSSVSDRVSCLHIDQKMRIWIGTDEGVSFYEKQGDLFSFIGVEGEMGINLPACIVSDSKNDLYIGSFNGFWRIKDGSKVAENLLSGKSVYSCVILNKTALLGTNSGLVLYDLEQQMIVDQEFWSDGADYFISSLHVYNSKVYVGSRSNGLWKANIDSKDFSRVPLSVFSEKFYDIKSINSDGKDKLIIGTDGAGLVTLRPDHSIINVSINDVNDIKSISSNGIYNILFGDEGILWVATYGGGINKVDLKKRYFNNISHIQNEENSLINNFTRAICEDDEGNIWYGTKTGLSIYSPLNKNWRHFSSLDHRLQGPDIILDLVEDGPYMWIASYTNGLFRMNKSTFKTLHYGPMPEADIYIPLSKIYTLLKDSKRGIWAGGIEGNLVRIQDGSSIREYPLSTIKDIIELKDGKILIAGRMGIQTIEGDSISDIQALKNGINGLDYTSINCVKENHEGTFFIGSNGDGLILYEPQTEKITKINQRNGLPSDVIQGMIFYNDSSLWLSTTRGLVNVLFNKQDTSFIIYDREDGLVSSEFNYGSFTSFKDGMMAFGGVDGVVLFEPERIERQKQVPKIVFEEFRLYKSRDEEEVAHFINLNNLEVLNLSYKERSFSIKFAGILHSTPSKKLFSWRMKGLDDHWSEPGEETQLNFVNLSPGEYQLHIKAANRDGVWSRTKILPIHISPPWWKTWWAYLLYTIAGLLALGGLLYAVSLFINKRNAEQQIGFFNSITHELKTPISILLSSLDSFDGKQEFKGVDKLKSTSRQLISLFEQLLNFHLVSSGKEINQNLIKISLFPYLEKLQKSFQPLLDEKDINLQIQGDWPKVYFYFDKYVLDKILYNLISNAIKYSSEKGEIMITIKEVKNELELKIQDNGIGIPKDQQKHILKRYYRGRNVINSQLPGTGLGLMIVKNLVEKDKGSIGFKSVENEGTVFTVRLKDKKEVYEAQLQEVQTSPDAHIFEDQESLDEFSGAKVLVVEDNDQLRNDLVEKIGIHFQVYEAENGKKGLDIALEVFPDLIITDLIMPEMDGMEMCKNLQNDINLSHIPIIMMTVLSDQKQKMKSVESGVTTYLEKPINYSYLLAKVINSLTWSKKLREKYLHQVDVENAEKFRNQKDADFVDQLERFVLMEIKEENLSVHDLCKFVGMSRTGLYMKLKSMLDLSPQNFIIQTRLKYARKLLLESEYNIKEVAFKSGFSSPKYFSTSFKKLFGESPSVFLKKLGK